MVRVDDAVREGAHVGLTDHDRDASNDHDGAVMDHVDLTLNDEDRLMVRVRVWLGVIRTLSVVVTVDVGVRECDLAGMDQEIVEEELLFG